MQFTTLFLSALAAVGSMAAPAQPRAEAVSMMADATTWTITNAKRVVNADGTQTIWSFGVDNGQTNTPCTEVINGTKSYSLNGGPVTCGPYTVTSGWSDQFGPGNAFTTFAVVDYSAKLIVYPAYTDNEVASGNAVTPDKSYTPSKLG